ncbi:MAG: hypothetical protein NVS3B18_11780 [Candidatus Dormibacteria bacterium]
MPSLISPLPPRPRVDAAGVLRPRRWRETVFSLYGVGWGLPSSLHRVIWPPITWAVDPAPSRHEAAVAQPQHAATSSDQRAAVAAMRGSSFAADRTLMATA